MKNQLVKLLICPSCLPREHSLVADIKQQFDGDIQSGSLQCPHCTTLYPIVDGVAMLDPQTFDSRPINNKYEINEVVSSYLWSHFCDLLNEEHGSQAYVTWSGLVTPQSGIALDAGGAVGRFTFEMSAKCDFSIGIDTSQAFIRTARQLMQQGCMVVPLKEEGMLRRETEIHLPDTWHSDRVEFIVANALALPFRSKSFTLFSSLNLVDKVPSPISHLEEMNRVTSNQDAQFLLSDPFSWSTEAAPVAAWLGGKTDGPFAGGGLANIATLLTQSTGPLAPAWQVSEPGHVWWKIRTHRNHYELIRSWYIHARR
jgi:uncharacterized protein YbaR (Trm112 family)